MVENKEMLIEAVKSSKSAKSALNGVKLLLGSAPVYSDIAKQCLPEAWEDARRKNASIERSEGKKSETTWPKREEKSQQEIEKDLEKHGRFKLKSRVLGHVLSTYDEVSLRRFFEMMDSKNPT